MAPVPKPLEDRFWPKVVVRSDDKCWPWTAGKFKDKPYGQFQVRAGEVERLCAGPVRAHRLAFRLIHGYWPSPLGLHGCDNPLCCNALNPQHVHEGTSQQNTDEMRARGRQVVTPPLLSALEAEEIRKLYVPGVMSYPTLADRTGIFTSTVWRIVRRIPPYV